MTLGFLLLAASIHAPAARAGDWRMYLRDPAHSSFNASETTLAPDNLARLAPAWKYPAGGPLSAAPTVANGAVYFGTWKGDFIALEATTGRELWRRFAGVAAPPEEPNCFPAIGVGSQAVVDGDAVYIAGGDSAVYAFEAATGRELWRLPLADPKSGSYLWSSLTLSGRALYAGVASLGDCPLVRGALVRIDLDHPSAPLFRYLAPAGATGAGIWSTPAIDERTNTVYVTTGTGEQDAGTGLWGSALLALDAATLEIQAHYFLPTASVEDDIEWGSSPTLVRDPDRGPLVAATGKDGILYAFALDGLDLAWKLRLAAQCICPECGCGSISTPAYDGRTLFAGAGVPDPEDFDSGSVYAVDPATGRARWMRAFDGVVIAPVTVAGGMVFVSTTSGLEILSAGAGETLWKDPTRGALYSQAVVADGTVYCTYVNGEVIAWRP